MMELRSGRRRRSGRGNGHVVSSGEVRVANLDAGLLEEAEEGSSADSVNRPEQKTEVTYPHTRACDLRTRHDTQPVMDDA